MKKLNRLLAALLTFAMMISMVPTAAFAATDYDDPDYDDELTANEIPEDYDEYGYYYGDDPDKMSDETLGVSTLSLDDEEEGVSALSASGMVDIVFIIDSTGSMADEISNVRTNLNSFTQVLEDAGLDYRIAIVEYKDITVSGEENSTIVHQKDGVSWLTSADDVSDILGDISVTGGGDNDETVVDALGCMLSPEELTFRNDASKFAILLTDAGYKDDNDYGYADMDAVIAKLQEVGISTSVISDTDYEDTYYSLYNGTDGIFCDIYGTFKDELIKLASYVERAVKPVTLTIKATRGTVEDDYITYTVNASITSTETEETGLDVTNLNITLDLNDDTVAEETLASLAPNEKKEYTWNVDVPVTEEDTVYIFKLRVTSDDFATGVVCMAQDTINVAGTGENDYNFVFGRDNYCFINIPFAFSSETYYISDEDLEAFIDGRTNEEVQILADAWAKGNSSAVIGKDGKLEFKSTKKEHFLANDLIDFDGSCYGMSLTAALFRVGALDPNTWGGETTYQLPKLNSNGGKSDLESMINIYHISQSLDYAWSDAHYAQIETEQFPDVAKSMWEMAENIGKEGYEQQPYIVDMQYYGDPDDPYDDKGHAVICYGAEKCAILIGSGAGTTKYDKKLLIADPNCKKTSYIFISQDFDTAFYSYTSSSTEMDNYDYFGYFTPSLDILNTDNYDDFKVNHLLRIDAANMTDFMVSDGDKTTVVIAGKVVNDEIGVMQQRLVGTNIIGEGTPIFIIKEGALQYTITPTNDERIDATVYFDGKALSVNAEAKSASFSADGSVKIKNAEGDMLVEATVNEGNIDFASVTGTASGDVTVKVNNDSISVKGDIDNTVVTNTDIDGLRNDTYSEIALDEKGTAYADSNGTLSTSKHSGGSDGAGAGIAIVGAGAVVAGGVIASNIVDTKAEAALPDSSLLHVYEGEAEKTFETNVNGKALIIKTQADSAVLTGARSYLEQLSAQGIEHITFKAETSAKTLYIWPVTKKTTVDVNTLLTETPVGANFVVNLE